MRYYALGGLTLVAALSPLTSLLPLAACMASPPREDATVHSMDTNQTQSEPSGAIADTGERQAQNCPAEPLNGFFKCASRSPTYHLCQCCPDTPPACTEERCGSSASFFTTERSPSEWPTSRCETALLKGCLCRAKQLYECADVEYDESDEYLAQTTHEQRVEAVRHVVEMFGGWENVPGYRPRETPVVDSSLNKDQSLDVTETWPSLTSWMRTAVAREAFAGT
ncbi:hypothetical protein OIDMADRAFT_178641 [Oidiodendron maius Zn]|uniref:Uncharacterized protein n=1 Tax=Oidiodendron maius (strain Zn) TaxID=913774 RepID=A0A0C3HI57_OIDMZ|nr:hypothetical protein OIDMADRAFT_178641 [Oidiodendron maius Zn]